MNYCPEYKGELCKDCRKNKSQREGFKILDDAVSRFGLGDDFGKEAGELLKKSYDAGLLRGRGRDELMLASIYLTGKNREQIVPIKHLSQFMVWYRDEGDGGDSVTQTEAKRKIRNCYKKIARKFGIAIIPARPESFIERTVENLKAEDIVSSHKVDRLREETKDIIEETKDELQGHSPKGIAAAALYTAAQRLKLDIKQREVAKLSGCTVVTIRKNKNIMFSEMRMR